MHSLPCLSTLWGGLPSWFPMAFPTDDLALRGMTKKQKTDKGLEIPVPTKGDFDAAMQKVAPPVGRKRPDGKDRPQKQSG